MQDVELKRADRATVFDVRLPDQSRSQSVQNFTSPNGLKKNGRATVSGDDQYLGYSEDRSTQVGGSRFAELMQTMHSMSKLHKGAVSAQIDARQKRRAAGFKRRDVWTCDGNFMKELQRLLAEEKLHGFGGVEELVRLAEECQTVRDDLGPLEQDGIEAEQRLEGEVWKLEQAAESAFDEFEEELLAADSYSSVTSSVSSSSYHSEDPIEIQVKPDETLQTAQRGESISPKLDESNTKLALALPFHEQVFSLDFATPQEYMLRGISDVYVFRGDHFPASDSAIEDIDLPYAEWESEKANGYLQYTQRNSHQTPASVERYPELINEIESPRERINKWLLNTTLLSHLEADVLRQQLNSILELPPSSWSQLVIAYWTRDQAAIPLHQNPPTTIFSSRNKTSEPRVSSP